MGLSLEEQETHINWYRDSQNAYVFTTDRTTMTKLDRLCREHPNNYKCIGVDRAADNHEIVSKGYIVGDKSLISFRGAKIVRELTEERRAELAERMRNDNPRFKASATRAEP